MQADGRAAMDFMTRELRTAFGTPVVANNTISFDRVEDTGYSSGGNTPTTLNAVGKNWQGSMFKFSENAPYTVRIIAGTGAGQARTIEQNTSAHV
jgi:Tfp pilus assembly protein PilW